MGKEPPVWRLFFVPSLHNGLESLKLSRGNRKTFLIFRWLEYAYNAIDQPAKAIVIERNCQDH